MMKPTLDIDKIHGRGAKQACLADSRTGAAGAWIEEKATLLNCHDAGVEGWGVEGPEGVRSGCAPVHAFGACAWSS